MVWRYEALKDGTVSEGVKQRLKSEAHYPTMHSYEINFNAIQLKICIFVEILSARRRVHGVERKKLWVSQFIGVQRRSVWHEIMG